MLINLAKESTDEAARLLGRLSAERTNAERQLGMLQDYRHDYLERLQQAMTSGMSASDCHNYQRFIGTLDDAIVQQQGVLQQADENLNKGRLYYQQEKRKLIPTTRWRKRAARRSRRRIAPRTAPERRILGPPGPAPGRHALSDIPQEAQDERSPAPARHRPSAPVSPADAFGAKTSVSDNKGPSLRSAGPAASDPVE